MGRRGDGERGGAVGKGRGEEQNEFEVGTAALTTKVNREEAEVTAGKTGLDRKRWRKQQIGRESFGA
jgi:hypothetical protein